jgi:hypothetical protein
MAEDPSAQGMDRDIRKKVEAQVKDEVRGWRTEA